MDTEVSKQTPGMWNKARWEKLASRGYYQSVGGEKPTKVRISGAVNKDGEWKKADDYIYIPKIRLAGPRAKVQAYMKKHGHDKFPSENAIYSKKTYKDSASFQNEVSEARKAGESKGEDESKPQHHGYTLEDFAFFARAGAPKKATKTGGPAGSGGSKKTKKKAAGGTASGTGRGANAAARLKEAESKGQYLDVSNMLPNLTKTKIGPLTAGGKKVHVPGLNVVSNRNAKGAENYARFVRALERPDGDNLIRQFEDLVNANEDTQPNYSDVTEPQTRGSPVRESPTREAAREAPAAEKKSPPAPAPVPTPTVRQTTAPRSKSPPKQRAASPGRGVKAIPALENRF